MGWKESLLVSHFSMRAELVGCFEVFWRKGGREIYQETGVDRHRVLVI